MKIQNNFKTSYTVVASTDCDTVVHFNIYPIEHWEDRSGLCYWINKHDPSRTTANIDDAQRFIHGEVKFDGCSYWHYDEQDRNMIHFCEKQQLLKIVELLEIVELLVFCLDLAARLHPEWD